MYVSENSPWTLDHDGEKNGGKRLQIRRPMERNLDLHMACSANSSQGKDAGVSFRLNYSIHQHTLVLDMTQVLESKIFFNLAKVNAVPCMCAATLSLSDSK